MDVRLSFVFARRSVRHYTPEPVSDADVQALLEGAMAAPSARNTKPWHFVVVRDRGRLLRLANIHPNASVLEGAALGIAVCGEPHESEYWVQDTSAATENILLSATVLGLGAVWIGVHPKSDREQKVREILNLTPTVTPLCLVAIGHPAEEKPSRTQYDPSRVHYEQW
ncbi:MAG: nitroreductase family protein [Armatimonadota bacterium]